MTIKTQTLIDSMENPLIMTFFLIFICSFFTLIFIFEIHPKLHNFFSILENTKKEKDKMLKIKINNIKSGEYFKNTMIKQILLQEKNKVIIQTIYENIEKANLSQEDLLRFLNKNKLEINEKICNLLS